MLFIFKKKKKKKKTSVTKKTQLTNPFCTKLERRRGEQRKILEVGGPQFLKNLMNFSKIIFIWQQVTFKNLLSGDT